MRELLTPYRGVHRLNYLCILASELLDEVTLSKIPALAAGFASVSATLDPRTAQAIKNIRLTGYCPGTLRELQLMVDSYHQHFRQIEERKARGEEFPSDEVPQRYLIDDALRIKKTWTHLIPEDIEEAIVSLTGLLPLRQKPPAQLHNVNASADVETELGYAGTIEPLGFLPPEPPLYDLKRTGLPPGEVKWAALVSVAKDFDLIDEAAGRQAPGEQSWFRRLHDHTGRPTAVLKKAGSTGLGCSDAIDLVGIKHLIGLPGAGKTTLLYLLAGYFSRREIQACFLFPSIEVASGFIETLARYQVDVGLLSGQSETSRAKHVLNFATALAAQNHGFGVTRQIAPFFATNCALAGFASDEETDFPHMNPPCQSLRQKAPGHKRARFHRCALCSVCGFQHGERALSSTPIWAGHILSTDRRVSPLFVDSEVRHFEYLARTFDVLVVDECDGAQNALDARGTPLLKLAGESNSLWHTLIRDLHDPAARGHNAFVAGVTIPTILEMTGRFGRANERLLSRIIHFPKNFRQQNANTLLTTLSIISDIFPADDEANEAEQERHTNARRAFEMLWDAAIKVVAFRYSIPEDDDEDQLDLPRTVAEAAGLTGESEENIRAYYDSLLRTVELWDRDANDAAINQLCAALRNAPGAVSPHDAETLFAYGTLLVCVSLLVLQHFGLAPHLRLMNSMNLVSDNVFESRPSKDVLGILPESLVGRLNGVRYTVSEEGNVDLAHVGFTGTPRLLPQRMIELGKERGRGMAVLLTSATSMLEQSPSFHVAIGPDYVLQRPNAGSGWSNSRYVFFPKMDPQSNHAPLRFSGARMSQREYVLKTMVDQLLRNGALSDVEQVIRGNDVVEGEGRKAAFIVNSYDQCEILFNHIQANHPTWRGRVRYLVQPRLHGTVHDAAVTAAEVETLGDDQGWDLLIFPMNAIGRGVNIVYRFGKRQDKAMLGSLFFLTRPHPRGDSLQLIQGLVGRASEKFDRRRFISTNEALAALKEARKETGAVIEYLLRIPLMAQVLGSFAEPFVADQMIIILQTIGRAMRGDCPAFVYFVDAAWAPRSARGQADTARSSMLVMMQSILQQCLKHHDPAIRECYQSLYQSFSVPMNAIENLNIEGTGHV